MPTATPFVRPSAMPIATPFSRPLCVMLKPASAFCNLACEYCYYLEKGKVGSPPPFGGDRGETSMLSDDLLETFIRQYLEAQTMPEVLFTWHGGEPLLRPIAFYERALQLQQKYARGRHVDNCLQTNGTLINDEWCRFLRDNHFLVGISIDGPQHLHDAYRRDRHGQPTWERVMHGIRLLQQHGVEWNAMATVNRLNADHPHEFYRFFRDIGCQFLQFTPVVERFSAAPVAAPPVADGLPVSSAAPRLLAGSEPGGQVAPFSVTPQQWGRFLCAVYDEWVRHDVGTIFVQIFDATLTNWAGVTPGLCSLGTSCAHNAVMETDGSVYCCDHFVFPDYLLGNIAQTASSPPNSPLTTHHLPLTSHFSVLTSHHSPPTLTQLLYGPRQQQFGRQKTDALPRQCSECSFLFACHGECPRNRFATDRYGEPGLNYLCEGYRRFFAHVAADMDFMLAELRAGRAPANIMKR